MKIKPYLLIIMCVIYIISSSCQRNQPAVRYQQINDNWKLQQNGQGPVIEAEVPGCVHLDLLYADIIDDPYYRDNESGLQWIENEEWIYTCVFDARQDLLDMEHIELIFEGIDTYADVYLNDKIVLRADNMFRTWIIDCKDQLRQSGNILKVHFYSPVMMDREKANKLNYALPDIRGFSRKAPYHYGWDWGPRFVTSGIWRPVTLLGWNSFMIDNVQVQQKELAVDHANLTAQATIESTGDQLVDISIRNSVSGVGLASQQFTLKQGVNIIHLSFRIENPELWWPNGYGEPSLYKVECVVSNDQYIDKETVNVGLRTVELIQEDDGEGASFYFKVNGKPLFAKGANYIPQESFVPRLRADQYRQLIASAKQANMNMLRVWGGGIYEEDLFYDLCDQNGILVWQDFMFACNLYPGDEKFLENVRQEAIDNLIRLRNHPCIAIWCGNNEIAEAWNHWTWQKQLGYSEKDSVEGWNNYENLFHKLLPDLVSQYDASRPYWPSSPAKGWGVDEAYKSGDVHYWGVWWGAEPFETYEMKVGRFMSEYGFQGMPDMQTIEMFTQPGDLVIGSPVMEVHQKHPRGTELIDIYMKRDYPQPEAFEDYVYVSQLVQAEGIRTAIEAHRRARPYCMGTLYWQLNDCWPVTSWSSIDYYGRWKALHYFVKKAYGAVLLSCERGTKMKFHAINDSLESVRGLLELALMNFEGDILWEHHQELTITGNDKKVFFQIPASKILGNHHPAGIVLDMKLTGKDGLVARNIKYFVSARDLKLSEPLIEYSIDSIPGGALVKLQSNVLAKNVYLWTTDPFGFFSDNYFDLLPKDTVEIIYSGKYSATELNKLLNIRTLNHLISGHVSR